MVFIFPDKDGGNLADVSMWSARPKMYDWEQLTAAWEDLGLDPSKVNDFRGHRRQIGRLETPAADLWNTLINTVFSDITEEDIKNFKLSLEIAREELHLHYTYLVDTYRIRHDSSVEDVMKSIPNYKFIDAFRIKHLVQDAIDTAKIWYERTFRNCDFELLLATRKFIRRTTPLSEALKKLKADPSFRESTFKDLSDGELEKKINQYLMYLKFCKDKDAKSSFKRVINKEYESHRNRYLNVMSKLRVQFHTPAHFLIHRERFMGYAIGNPIAEITKLRVYLSDYISGVPPPLDDDSMDSSSFGAGVPSPLDPLAGSCDDDMGISSD